MTLNYYAHAVFASAKAESRLCAAAVQADAGHTYKIYSVSAGNRHFFLFL